MKELEATADIDPLTQVFNRRGFDRELKRSLAYVKRYWTPRGAVLYRSRRLQAGNDQHGHAAGDALLTAIAPC